ncbi:Far-red impaired responsive family protein [Fagus crenata]
MLTSIIGCKTSAAIWSIIQEHFSQKSVANSSLYRKRLTSLVCGTRPISEYLQEAKSIVDAFAAIGELVSNKDLVNAVLGGLGSDFDMLVTAIESFDTLPLFSTLHSRLLNFEARHKTTTQPTPSAFLASQTSTTSFPNYGSRNNSRNRGKKNNSRNHHPRNDNSGILGSAPTTNFPTTTSPCQLCFNFGHAARSCPRLSTFAAPPVPRSLNIAFAGLQIAPAHTSRGYPSGSSLGFSPQPPYDHAYYPDTSALTHMTGNPALLQQCASYNGPDSVLLGNGDQLLIAYTGNMTLPIGSSSFHLNNVYGPMWSLQATCSSLSPTSSFCISSVVILMA